MSPFKIRLSKYYEHPAIACYHFDFFYAISLAKVLSSSACKSLMSPLLKMPTAIEAALELEGIFFFHFAELDVNLYRSKELWKPTGARGVFGGQVVGQSLMAAMKSVPSRFQVHSLHSYFVKSGDDSIPIVYCVNPIRDGKSFCTRTISARQRGEVIFTCEASFQIPEAAISVKHQLDMPKVDPPESFVTREQLFKKFAQDPKTPAPLAQYFRLASEKPYPLDIRYVGDVTLENYLHPKKTFPAKQMVWMRANEALSNDVRLHQCIAAYATDQLILSTSLLPAGLTFTSPKIALMASLDHCVWFHAPFRADEWLLYEMNSPWADNARGLGFGRVFTQNGQLVVSCAQEGVIREKSSKI